MTFTEAAVEVLRLVGKPLHYKKITELAIERNLLSHVGKTPEVTMSSRLATMVKRDRGEVPIIKVKPGVFGLREFSEEQLADLSGDVDELPEVEVENEENKPEPALEGEGDAAAPKVASEPRKPLPGADVFPEEEDDDEPILGGNDEDEDDEDEAEGGEREGAAAAGESRSSRRKRKRRRRGRGDGPDENGAEEAAAPAPREAREPREPREPRRNERRNERRTDDRNERRDRERDRDRDRERDRERDPYADLDREPLDGDLLGKDLADAVASVLSQSGPRGMSVLRVADMLVRRGRLAGDPHALVPTIMAAVRADVARKKIERARPRFRIDGTALVLTDFLLPQEVTRAEVDVLRAAERQRERARRAYLRCLGELTNAGLAEVVATWLNAEGLVGLRAVRRPGSGPGELHLAGTLRRGVEEMRVAVVVYRDLRELGRERVIEARGSLHYYGNASTAWLVSLGQVTGGAKEEAQAQAAAPVTLFDGMALAAAMERVGVGLSVQYVPVSAIDVDLLESLRGPRSDRDERDRDNRERDNRERDSRDRDRGGRDRDRGGRDRVERRPEAQARPLADDEVERESDDEELDYESESEEREEDREQASAEANAEANGEAVHGEGEGEGEAAGEARDGRKRRRRRRRRGGRDREAGAAGANGDESSESSPGDAADWEGEDGEGSAPESDQEGSDEQGERSESRTRESAGYAELEEGDAEDAGSREQDSQNADDDLAYDWHAERPQQDDSAGAESSEDDATESESTDEPEQSDESTASVTEGEQDASEDDDSEDDDSENEDDSTSGR